MQQYPQVPDSATSLGDCDQVQLSAAVVARRTFGNKSLRLRCDSAAEPECPAQIQPTAANEIVELLRDIANSDIT